MRAERLRGGPRPHGPNGAGKTTLFNLLSRFLAPTHGVILYEGADVTSVRPAEIARRGIVRSFQISAVFPNLSVRENLVMAARPGAHSTSRGGAALRNMRNLTGRWQPSRKS